LSAPVMHLERRMTRGPQLLIQDVIIRKILTNRGAGARPEHRTALVRSAPPSGTAGGTTLTIRRTSSRPSVDRHQRSKTRHVLSSQIRLTIRSTIAASAVPWRLRANAMSPATAANPAMNELIYIGPSVETERCRPIAHYHAPMATQKAWPADVTSSFQITEVLR
jgi:hypothetical protein